MEPIPVVKLNRFYSDQKQSLGLLSCIKGMQVFIAKTLELPWKANLPDVSCIPADRYLVKWTKSPRLSRIAGHDVYTYEILNVPYRSGIRMHSANFFFQLLGCIALGAAFKDLNADQNLDVEHSGNTMDAFAKFMEYKDFYLDITNSY